MSCLIKFLSFFSFNNGQRRRFHHRNESNEKENGCKIKLFLQRRENSAIDRVTYKVSQLYYLHDEMVDGEWWTHYIEQYFDDHVVSMKLVAVGKLKWKKKSNDLNETHFLLRFDRTDRRKAAWPTETRGAESSKDTQRLTQRERERAIWHFMIVKYFIQPFDRLRVVLV